MIIGFIRRGDNESIFKEKCLLLYQEWIKVNPDFYSVEHKLLTKKEIEAIKKEGRVVEYVLLIGAVIPAVIFHFWLANLVFTGAVLFVSVVVAVATIYSTRRTILNLENGGQKKIVKDIFVNHYVKNINESEYICIKIGEEEFVTSKSIANFNIGDYLEIHLLPKIKPHVDSVLEINRLESKSIAYLNLLQEWKKLELSHQVKLLR